MISCHPPANLEEVCYILKRNLVGKELPNHYGIGVDVTLLRYASVFQHLQQNKTYNYG